MSGHLRCGQRPNGTLSGRGARVARSPARWGVMLGSRSSLLNNLIRPQLLLLRDAKLEGLGALEVDDEVELRGALDGQVGWQAKCRCLTVRSTQGLGGTELAARLWVPVLTHGPFEGHVCCFHRKDGITSFCTT